LEQRPVHERSHEHCNHERVAWYASSAGTTYGRPTKGLGRGIRGLRIGVVRHFYQIDHKASKETVRPVNSAEATLSDLGAGVRGVELSPLADWHAARLLILPTEGYVVHEASLKSRPENYGEVIRNRTAMGAFISGADHVEALRRRRELAREMAVATPEVDILTSATQPTKRAASARRKVDR
jgi:aspartyl-tRNA(Asn)/glutamyl-tRNA(Gln) amidotransferase subunit A